MFICLPLFFPISSSKCAKSRFKLLLHSPDLRSLSTRSVLSQGDGRERALHRGTTPRPPVLTLASHDPGEIEPRTKV